MKGNRLFHIGIFLMVLTPSSCSTPQAVTTPTASAIWEYKVEPIYSDSPSVDFWNPYNVTDWLNYSGTCNETERIEMRLNALGAEG
jgi:hypothetical protein